MRRPIHLNRPSSPAVGEILTLLPAGEGIVPRCRGGQGRDRVLELTQLIAALLRAGAAVGELAYRKSLEAARASVKALANDLACYANFCARTPGLGLPADAPRGPSPIPRTARREASNRPRSSGV